MANLLFGKEFERLHDDCLEGSINENRIFREVFFHSDNGRKNRSSFVTGVSNFEHNYANNGDGTCFSNVVNSTLIRPEEPCSSAGGLKGIPFHRSSPEDFTLVKMSTPDMNVYDLKGSTADSGVEALTTCFNSAGSCDGDDSIESQPVAHTGRWYIVESSSEGVAASCYLVKRHHFGPNKEPEIGKRDAFNSASSCLEETERKEIAISKAIASPVSQESHVTKLLVVSPPSIATNNSGPSQPAKPRWKDHCFVALGEAELSMPKDVKNDPRPLLRYHVNRLLRVAGWVIGRRRRNSKSKLVGEYVYKSPGGRPFREFQKAWSLCKASLFTDANNKLQNTEPIQWSELTHLRSDLSITASEIEKLGELDSNAALAHVWCLLDPFVHVVFIKKTIRLLKQGRVVKAKRNVVIHPYGKCDAACCSDSLPDMLSYHCDKRYTGPLKTINGTATKSRSVSGNERISLCRNSFHLCDPDSTCDQVDFHSFDVPIRSGDVNISLGGSLTVSCMGDSNKSTLLCGKERYDNDEEYPVGACNDLHVVHLTQEDEPFHLKQDLLDLQLGYVDEDRRSSKFDDVSFAGQASIRRKTHKKSKKLSEIKGESLYKDGNLGPSSCETGMQLMDGNGFKFGSSTRNYSMGVKHANYRSKKFKRYSLKDDDLLISAIKKMKSVKSIKRSAGKSQFSRKRKSKKGSCKLRPRSLKRGGKHSIEGKWSITGQRTVLSWLIHSGAVSINDVIQYRDTKDGMVVKDGFVTCNGILCKCCGEVLSISDFKSHGGYEISGPCLNLFMESGKPLSLCQLEAWSAEYKAKKGSPRTRGVEETDENDDSCGRCGDVGELICCDSCPSTFHQACLYAQDLPEGDWYCPQCTCRICGDVVDRRHAPKPSPVLKCTQCENCYHKECMQEKTVRIEVASDAWFCDESCQEVYLGLQSHVGSMNLLSDGFCWTLLKCIDDDQKVQFSELFCLEVECNAKLAVALTLMEECFLPMVDSRTGIDMIPQLVYNWGSHFARLNYQGFYTVILEKKDIVISVASIRIHGVTVAELPLIATCSKYRRQGMCRRLMNSIESMLKSLKVEKLVISAIPELVETWTKGFGFAPLEDHEKISLSKISLMVFPGSVWLKKPLCDNHKTEQIPDDPSAGASFPSSSPYREHGNECLSVQKEAQMGEMLRRAECKKPETDQDQESDSVLLNQNHSSSSPFGSELVEQMDQQLSFKEIADSGQEKRLPKTSSSSVEETFEDCELRVEDGNVSRMKILCDLPQASLDKSQIQSFCMAEPQPQPLPINNSYYDEEGACFSGKEQTIKEK